MKPYEQGALDGLCGVYCVVNATRIIAGVGEEEARQLFQEIIYYLDKTKDLPKILITGMGIQTIGAILADVVGERINCRAMPFKQYPDTPLDTFWAEMINFMGDGERRAILTAIGGPHWDHWSIVESITDKQVRFFDSYKLKRLNRSRCATIRCTSSRPHLLAPTHTYFLS